MSASQITIPYIFVPGQARSAEVNANFLEIESKFNAIASPTFPIDASGADDTLAFQTATDAIAVAGGGVLALTAGATYTIGCPTSATYAGGTIKRSVLMTSGMVVQGNGATIKMASSTTTSGAPIATALFFANTALSKVVFRDVTFDLNGANNSVNSTNILQSAIAFSGDGAYCNDLLLDNCRFLNPVGSCVVLLSQTNTVSQVVGFRNTIRNCSFSATNSYLTVTDHSTISGAVNDALVTGCTFTFSAARTDNIGVVWDLQGTNNRFVHNVVEDYFTGPQVGANYVTPTTGCVVAHNVLRTRGPAVNFWRENVNCVAIDGVTVHNNTIILDDTTPTGGLVKSAVSLVTSYLIKNITVRNNDCTKTGTAAKSFGVLSGPVIAGQVQDGIVVRDNTFEGFWTDVYVNATAAAIGTVEVTGNTLRNTRLAAAETNSLGIQVNGVNTILHAIIRGNRMLNPAAGTFSYGIYVGGTVTTLDVGGNSYQGLSVGNYNESSATIAVRRGDFDRTIFTTSLATATAGIVPGDDNTYKITLSSPLTMGAPVNATNGQRMTFLFIQVAGGNSVGWNAVFKHAWVDTGNTASKRSAIRFEYDGTNWNQIAAQTPYI